MKRNLLLLTLILISFFPLAGQEENFVKENYDKSECQVEMRDGIKLYTIVYSPKDQSDKYPILMQRTPYSIGPYGERMRRSLSPNDKLEKDKYIFCFRMSGASLCLKEYLLICDPYWLHISATKMWMKPRIPGIQSNG